MKALCEARILHRDFSLKNIYLIEKYPKYPQRASEDSANAVSFSPSLVGSRSSTLAAQSALNAEDEDFFASNKSVRRGFLSDFDYACLIKSGTIGTAEEPTDSEDRNKKVRTVRQPSNSTFLFLTII